MNYRDGLAVDAWIVAVPDDPYGPCPCGCGKAFRFVARDEATLAQHEQAFRVAWLAAHPEPTAGVVVPGSGTVFVCESCLRGEHQSYGCDHRSGPEDRRGCKNLSPDGRRQCLCNPDWPELAEAISAQHQHQHQHQDQERNMVINPIIATIHNVTNNSWHPVLFVESPMPGPDSPGKPVRHKSKMHHTTGFASRAESDENARAELAVKIPGARLELDSVFDWDGTGVPAMVHFFLPGCPGKGG